MKHVNYLSFFLLTLFSISFISCSDDDDNKLNTGITNQSWTEGKSLEVTPTWVLPYQPEASIFPASTALSEMERPLPVNSSLIP